MNVNEKIYVAGHRGLVGSAILRKLQQEGYSDLVFRSSGELDLTDNAKVDSFFESERPDYVFLAAAKVGGIQANIKYPVEFLLRNLMIQNSVIMACVKYKVKKLCFLGSSCIYPKECPQPMKEEYLLAGPLEPTNEGYALAKISGLKLVEYCSRQYGLRAICPMPCNLFGKGDSFDLEHSHVLSALVKRFSDAVRERKKQVVLWGSGNARREFLYVDDLANILIGLMQVHDSSEIINIGMGKDVSIRELAELIAEKVGFSGEIHWDTSKPDGMMRKCLDISKMRQLGFESETTLSSGIDFVIREYDEKCLLGKSGEAK